MGHDRFPAASLAVCVVLSLMTGCQKFADHSLTKESSEQAEKTRAMQRVAESSFWHVAPTEEEIERLVATIARQPSESIVFLGADLRVHTIGPVEANSYRTGQIQTISFDEGVDPLHIQFDLLDYPGHSRASILQVLPMLLAEQGTNARRQSWRSELAAGEYEIAVLIDRSKLMIYEVDMDDILRALTGYQIVNVDPEHLEGILINIAVDNPDTADSIALHALEDMILVEHFGRPVRLREVGVIRLTGPHPRGKGN